MNFVAAILNLVLFVYTCIILFTDGLPKDIAYFLFTLFLLLVPVLNLAMFFLGARRRGWFTFSVKGRVTGDIDTPGEVFVSGKIINATAIFSNVALPVFSVMAYIDHYPHPKEDGFVVFVVLLVIIPVLSGLMILRNGSKIIHDDMK